MRWFGVLLIILATLASTLSLRAEDWTLANGKVYKNVTIIAQEGDGVRVTYDGGVGKFPYYELPDDILLRIGQDPATQAIKRAAVRKQQAEDALKAQQDAAAAAELKKQQAEAAAVDAALKATQNPAANPAPGTASNPATTPGQPSAPNSAPNPTANATPAPPPPSPIAPPPPPPPVNPAPVPATADSSVPPDAQQSIYPNSKFQYDEGADVNYLDSPVISIEPLPAEVAPATPAPAAAPIPAASLYLRIATEGHRAESPDEVKGVFASPVPLKNLKSESKVIFLVDGAFIPTDPPLASGDSSSETPSNMQVAFVLTPEHMRTLLLGKKVNVRVGTYDYRIDDAGIATFRAFLGDVNHLPPASTSFVRVYHRFIDRLPSFITMISTACEYIILGAFAIVMVGSIAAFVMGLTRFIKM